MAEPGKLLGLYCGSKRRVITSAIPFKLVQDYLVAVDIPRRLIM